MGYLIVLYLETGQAERALALIGRLIDDHSQNPDLLNVLATTLLQLEAYDKAERVLNDLMAIAPGYFGGRYNLAQLRYVTGEADEAKEILEQLLFLEPGNEEVRILLARAHLSLGESSEAIRILSEIQWTTTSG